MRREEKPVSPERDTRDRETRTKRTLKLNRRDICDLPTELHAELGLAKAAVWCVSWPLHNPLVLPGTVGLIQ